LPYLCLPAHALHGRQDLAQPRPLRFGQSLFGGGHRRLLALDRQIQPLKQAHRRWRFYPGGPLQRCQQFPLGPLSQRRAYRPAALCQPDDLLQPFLRQRQV
jgi:hypothetical protein